MDMEGELEVHLVANDIEVSVISACLGDLMAISLSQMRTMKSAETALTAEFAVGKKS